MSDGATLSPLTPDPEPERPDAEGPGTGSAEELSGEDRDLGFGRVVARESRRRLLNRDGTFNVRREGLGWFRSLSAYQALVEGSWSRFFAVAVAAYLAVNALFATGYALLGPDALAGFTADSFEGRWVESFFFSVQTVATVGYGAITPASTAANLLVTAEALVGLLGFGLAAGLIFARFARPKTLVLFSEKAVIAPYRGGRAFEFRIVNGRKSQIAQLEARVVLVLRPYEGAARRFHPLALERRRVSFFPLSWTIVHPIDDDSPLRDLGPRDLEEQEAEFLVLLSGFDESFSQTVHVRSSYTADEVVFGARFRDIFDHDDDEEDVLGIDVTRLSAVDRVHLPELEGGER